jgi:monoamine oxidase
VVTFIGGQFARDLTREGDEAAFDLALDSLTEVFGSDIRKTFVKGHFTKWDADPLARGAYSFVRPNHVRDRGLLATPVDHRLFFAGEACITRWATQAAAAYITGMDAGKAAAEEVK